VVECIFQTRNQVHEEFWDLDLEGAKKSQSNIVKPFSSTMAWYDLFEDMNQDLASLELGDPSDGKFIYPPDTTLTKANVDARRKAEHNRDKFWRFVDNEGRKYTGSKQHKHIQRILSEGKLHRTAPWAEKSGSDETIVPKHDVSYIPLSEIDHDPAKDITGNFDRLTITSKPKSKTRGSCEAATGADPPAPAESTSKPIYHVDKDSYVVFKMLFYSPNNGELPRSIR
jgi:hypothetical protein